ncbi:hypothetical protein TNCV_644991 [Trichonephila clavipes]|nr:hypothetical protein TNCV_644991 [Trichonephila clavipes]
MTFKELLENEDIYASIGTRILRFLIQKTRGRYSKEVHGSIPPTTSTDSEAAIGATRRMGISTSTAH